MKEAEAVGKVARIETKEATRLVKKDDDHQLYASRP